VSGLDGWSATLGMWTKLQCFCCSSTVMLVLFRSRGEYFWDGMAFHGLGAGMI
jgi:hypothetical protein